MPPDQPEPLFVRTARDAADLLGPRFEGLEHERLAVLYLAEDRRLLGRLELEEGVVDEIALPIRALMSDALRLGAAGIVLAHNHPSGDPSPSAADLAMTRRLAAVAAELEIRLHDHLIFAGGECRSMRADGLI